MLKFVTALAGALVAGLALAGSATDASAGYGHRRHGCCGPIAPTYHYHNKIVKKNVWRHHNLWRTKYVPRIHRIVEVTRIRPIIHVHDVTHVHHKIVGVVRPVHQHMTQWLPAHTYVTHKRFDTWSCGCSYRH
jgi:hypothetical protein